MVVDSSALISILLEEAGYESLIEKAVYAEAVFVGAPTALETAMVLSVRLRQNSRPFGKGLHPAALNFGNCMSYALAAVSGLPLLYAATDFRRTDIQSA